MWYRKIGIALLVLPLLATGCQKKKRDKKEPMQDIASSSAPSLPEVNETKTQPGTLEASENRSEKGVVKTNPSNGYFQLKLTGEVLSLTLENPTLISFIITKKDGVGIKFTSELRSNDGCMYSEVTPLDYGDYAVTDLVVENNKKIVGLRNDIDFAEKNGASDESQKTALPVGFSIGEKQNEKSPATVTISLVSKEPTPSNDASTGIGAGDKVLEYLSVVMTVFDVESNQYLRSSGQIKISADGQIVYSGDLTRTTNQIEFVSRGENASYLVEATKLGYKPFKRELIPEELVMTAIEPLEIILIPEEMTEAPAESRADTTGV